MKPTFTGKALSVVSGFSIGLLAIAGFALAQDQTPRPCHTNGVRSIRLGSRVFSNRRNRQRINPNRRNQRRVNRCSSKRRHP